MDLSIDFDILAYTKSTSNASLFPINVADAFCRGDLGSPDDY